MVRVGMVSHLAGECPCHPVCWIPAWAGMTGGGGLSAKMTDGAAAWIPACAGMTERRRNDGEAPE